MDVLKAVVHVLLPEESEAKREEEEQEFGIWSGHKIRGANRTTDLKPGQAKKLTNLNTEDSP
jgi:hypothetical protein